MSDEKVIVSKEKLNNLADSIKTLSNSSNDLTLEEMQSAVEAKTEKGFELIEEFTLTEDVHSVQRTKEPDGTPYNFKELFVRLEFPNRENLTENITLPSIQIVPYIDGAARIPSLYISSIILATTYLTHLSIDYLSEENNQIVVDYIASMTDDYFIALHKFLFPESKYSVEYEPYF